MTTTLTKEHTKYPTCPKCKTEMDTRVPRGPIVKNLLFFLPLKRYKCYGCGKKVYSLK